MVPKRHNGLVVVLCHKFNFCLIYTKNGKNYCYAVPFKNTSFQNLVIINTMYLWKYLLFNLEFAYIFILQVIFGKLIKQYQSYASNPILCCVFYCFLYLLRPVSKYNIKLRNWCQIGTSLFLIVSCNVTAFGSCYSCLRPIVIHILALATGQPETELELLYVTLVWTFDRSAVYQKAME